MLRTKKIIMHPDTFYSPQLNRSTSVIRCGGQMHKIRLATTCLHISAVLYVLVGVLFVWLSRNVDGYERTGDVAIGVFSLCLAAGVEVIAHGIRKRQFWAWVAGLCVFGLYAPSLFLPLGALGLWGLLDAGSRAEFGIGVQRPNDDGQGAE